MVMHASHQSVFSCKPVTALPSMQPRTISRMPALQFAQKPRRCVVRPLNTYTEERTAQSPSASQPKNQLEALKEMSVVVADTGEVELIKQYNPVDCTTNPSLVLKAVQLPQYEHFLGDAIAQEDGPVMTSARPFAAIADRLIVNMGLEVLKHVPGRVSTEVDAHLSYDTQGTIDKGLRLIDLYSKNGIDPSRVYIKIASTWEGIRACEELQKQGIDCNLTLLFSFAQGVACADAGAALVSPFVGRIMDWYKKAEGREFAPHEDPGVKSVQRIYKYYKKYGYNTIVMAASFRNIGEIQELAGCDNITISPALLGQLEANQDPLDRKLWPEMGGCDEDRYDMTAGQKEEFTKMHNADQMAVDKLKDGIDGFAKDQRLLEELIGKAIEQK